MLVFVLIFLISQSVKSAEVSPESNITESLATLSEKSSEKCMKEASDCKSFKICCHNECPKNATGVHFCISMTPTLESQTPECDCTIRTFGPGLTLLSIGGISLIILVFGVWATVRNLQAIGWMKSPYSVNPGR